MIPATYARHLSASYAGRYGTYSVTLYGPSGTAPGVVPSLTLAVPPEVAFGDTDTEAEFGGGLIAHSVDYRFADGADALNGLLGEDFDADTFLVRITGPDGLGGTWTVWTRPMQGEAQGSASPLVTRGAPLALGTHDGLASLEDIPGDSVTLSPVADVLSFLTVAMPGLEDRAASGFFDVHAAWSITDADNPGDLLDVLRFTDEIGGDPDRGEFGSVLEQLRALALSATLSCYLPTDVDPDAPRWEVVPRSRVGTTQDVSVIAPGAVTAGTLPDRAGSMPSYHKDEAGTGAGKARRVGVVTLAGSSPVVYGTPFASLDSGEETAVLIGRFAATPGLRFAIPDRRSVYTDGAGEVTLGDYRLEVDDAGTVTVVPLALTGGVLRTTADLPTGGLVTLTLVGESAILDTDNDDGTPDTDENARFGSGFVALEDDAGVPISDYAVTAGTAGGRAVTLALLPNLERFDGTEWAEVETYAGLVSGENFGTIALATAAERITQEATDLRTLDVTALGLWGPEARFTLAGQSGGNARSPFPEDVVMVPVSGDPDLKTGTTRLSLVAATES